MSTEAWQTKALQLVNRLRSATADQRLVWERTVEGHLLTTAESGGQAYLRPGAGGDSVVLSVLEPDGDTAFDVDSRTLPDDLLKLALLQLYVCARNGAVARMVERADEVLGDI